MIEYFIEPYLSVSVWQIAIEAVVFFFGIWSVYLAKKENIWVYPTGLIATGLTVYLLYQVGYYADMVINVYFTIMSFYGWYLWNKKPLNKMDFQLQVSKATFREKIIGLGLFFSSIVIAFMIYNVFSIEIFIENAIDIFTSGIFFTAMWLMAKKKLESWILWIIGDAIVIPIYLHRGLGILALQYVIFTILAIFAYIEWNQSWKKDGANSGSKCIK